MDTKEVYEAHYWRRGWKEFSDWHQNALKAKEFLERGSDEGTMAPAYIVGPDGNKIFYPFHLRRYLKDNGEQMTDRQYNDNLAAWNAIGGRPYE